MWYRTPDGQTKVPVRSHVNTSELISALKYAVRFISTGEITERDIQSVEDILQMMKEKYVDTGVTIQV